MSYYSLSQRLSEYAASFLSPYIKLDDEGCTTDAEGNEASFYSSKPNTQSSLSVGLWSGNVMLKNMELRPDAIENFLNADNSNNGATVRWKLQRGTIESVSIRIPWKSLVVGVGPSYPSMKRSSEKCSKGTLSSLSETEHCEGDVDADCEQINQNRGEDEVEAAAVGCTVVTIEGVRMEIGYEIIHEDRFLNALKLQSTIEKDSNSDQNLQGQEPGSNPSLDDAQKTVREEKNRILRIAERRLVAGLDPFPPSLMEELQSTIASSIQSGMKSASNSVPSNAINIESTSRIGSSYLARMEDYLSSTMRNIVWRTFDSLSVSIIHVNLSMVGCSHYDKDPEAILRRQIAERKQQEKEEEEKELPPMQVDSMHRRISQQRSVHSRYRASIRQDKTFSWHHRSHDLVPEELEVEGNITEKQTKGGERENSNVGSDEGEIEIGFLLDRLDIRPASLSDKSLGTESNSVMSEDSSSAASDKGPSTMKHFQVTKLGIFLRRSWKRKGDDDPSMSDVQNDDFIIDPTNIAASVRLYRSNPEAFEMNVTGSGTGSANLSPRKRSRGQNFTVNTSTTSETAGTSGTKRRGKRDKNPVACVPKTYHLRKRSRRLEISVQLGHIRSSLSPRQLFLLDSFHNSIDRLKRGRPSTTIRNAKAYDRELTKRRNEDGMPLIDWDERIMKAIPSLRSRHKSKSQRTLPTVVSSWWKYAYVNVVHENQQRNMLLDRCRGLDGQMKRRNGLALNLESRRNWDFEEQSKIRRDYVELYVKAHGSTIDADASVTTPVDVQTAKVRLDELEDQLCVERILLLKNVARAICIRRKDFALQSDDSKSLDVSTKSNSEHFYFPPNYLETEGHFSESSINGAKLTSSEPFERHDIKRGINSTITLAKKSTSTGPHLSELPRSSKTFFVSVEASGFSLALCNFVEDDRLSQVESEEQKFNISDDISALTGFSDGDDTSASVSDGRIKVQQMPDERLPADNYIPNCQFWATSRRGLRYEPIMLMHIIGISVSGQNVDGDHSSVECEFSVSGVDLMTFASQSTPKRIIALGQRPSEKGDVVMDALANFSKPSEATGICGIASFASGDTKQRSSVMTKLSSTAVMVDWAGMEKVVTFISESKDTSKKKLLQSFEDEALLCNAFATKSSPPTLSLEMECMALVIPTVDDRVNGVEKLYLITTIGSLSMETECLSAKANGKHDLSIEQSRDKEPGMLAALNDVNVFISRGGFDPSVTAASTTSLLQYPANIQLHVTSNGIEMPYKSKTEVTISSPVHLLVSDFRLQVLSKLVEIWSSYLLKICVKQEEGNDSVRLCLPTIADSVLTESKLSIPSLVMSLISDDEGDDTVQYNEFVRDKLEEIMTNHLSQLSCLDFEYPSKVSSECMSILCLGRCHAIGLSKHDAQTILHAAESHFKEDIAAMGTSPDERILNERMDSVIANATKKAVTEFDSMQSVNSSSWYPDCNLVVCVESLTINHSKLFLASLMQCTSGEVCVQNVDTQLLCISSSDDNFNMSTTISIENSCRNECPSSEVYFEVGHISAVFLAEAYIDAIETLQSTTQSLAKTKNYDCDAPVKSLRFNGNASSVSVLLTDKLIPFVKCHLSDVSIEKVSGPSSQFSKTVVVAGSLALECVSPHGSETYPDVVKTYQPSGKNGFDGSTALSIRVISPQTVTSCEQAEISIVFDGVRILILYQFICEFTQFMSSPKYGFGQYLSELHDKDKDESSSSATSKTKIVIRNSTLVMPRESESVDLVGIEVEELSISPCEVTKSWSIDDYSFSNKSTWYDDDPPSPSSSEGFFDCVDEIKSPRMSSGDINQSTDEGRIPRVKVQLRSARIFTALMKNCRSMSLIHMPQWNARVVQTGRVQNEERAFRACGDVDESIVNNINNRLWEEITTEPLSLGLTMDWAPTLRVLIETLGSDKFSGAAFDLRMSQFYLLMAIWYNNMDELPLMFPFTMEHIQVLSADPEPPLDWPEYGSREFIERIKNTSDCNRVEMAICVSSIKWRCSFDETNYFGYGTDPQTFPIMPSSDGDGKKAILLELENAICSIKKTKDTLLRVGLGATSLNLIDARYPEATLSQGIRTKTGSPKNSYMDFNWGLNCGRHTLVDGLPLPVQASVFITPDYFCMVNLGLDMAEAACSDLGLIWILLDYFGLYFKEPYYGHPAFEAETMVENQFMNVAQAPCLDIDFRLWLTDPHVIIPTSSEVDATCLMLEGTGLHYRYKSFGLHFSSQDIVAKDLGIVVLSRYIEPDLSRGIRQVTGSLLSSRAKTLVDGLSFSVKYEYDESTKFTRFEVRVPLSSQYFSRHAMDGIEPSDVEVKPYLVPPPLICNPMDLPSRNLGENETNIYFSYEYMKLAADLLIAFIGPNPNEVDETTECALEETTDHSSAENIFSVTAHLERIKLVISDPIMGMHRPFFSVSISSMMLSASRLKEIEHERKKADKFLGIGSTTSSQSSVDKDLQACMEATIFIDYFKLGITRNWEPLIEPFRCLTMYEQSSLRGRGIIFNAGCPLHVNITGASIDTIDDAIDTFGIFLLGKNADSPAHDRLPNRGRPPATIATTVTRDESGHKLTVLHRFPYILNEQERTAFSLKNCSGQRIRVHTQSDLEAELSNSKTTVIYLDHHHLMPVSFPATETVIKNLTPVEVPFEGDQNITMHKKQFIVSGNHSIDIQVPGFKWARGISLDKIGKHFIELIPRSPFVQAKVNADWRLKNALHILAEVNSVNGGRRLSVMSPFEVVNKTDHSIFVAVHPDPRHLPQGEISQTDPQESGDNIIDGISKLDPDGSYSIPYLLLESAMHLEGNHLGSIWIKPDKASCEEVGEFSHSAKDQTAVCSSTDIVGYPPRPIQLAKVLHESSVIFKNSYGDPRLANQVASGAEISCPVLDCNEKRKAIPFCYVVEVKRSPLFSPDTSESEVADTSTLSPPMMGKGLRGARKKFTKSANQSRVTTHAPVAYSLVIHPPIVIENLLPERGRFELMNATNKAVLWWGNLEPGERFPIHTIGLDVPLMLLVNLGFCRTPVGEGALIHEGEGDGFWLKTGWKTVGTAFSDTQDKVKKTISTITKSKDNRGAERVTQLQHKNQQRERKKSRTPRHSSKGGALLGDDIESKRAVNKNIVTDMARLRDTYSAEDIATETTVVDSVGQRLTLLLDNVLGNGGQRHVTIYSPFWIVNTTEHSLRYKQEKALSYPSGTVWGAEKDGSKPVDGSNRNESEDAVGINDAGWNLLNLNTIFPGTHGALKELEKLDNEASKPPILAALISEDLPLSVTSKLAFMFNFQDVLSLGGSPRLCIQLADTTNGGRYTSLWSSGFGLESVGVTQIVGMLCKDGRRLEVMVSISVGQGRLSNYTKFVRICPRYVVVNQLPKPIRLWQDNSLLHPNQVAERSDVPFESRKWIFVDGSDIEQGVINQYEPLFGSPTLVDSTEEEGETTAHHSACYIATIRSSELTAFHLPDTRLERLLRVDIGSGWNLSSSFPSDTTGQYVLSLDRARDIQTLPHVSNRAAPYFTVELPPPDGNWNGDLGVWFETDWGKDRSIVVKGTREGSYASHYTDIVVGDELVLIDDVPVTRFTFNDAMKHLKARLAYAQELIERDATSQPLQQRINMSLPRRRKIKKLTSDSSSTRKESVTLTFVTLEEKMRRLRSAAASKGSNGPENISAGIIGGRIVPHHSDTNSLPQESSRDILVDMNYLYQTIFVNIKEPDPTDPLHRIINRSSSWDIYYRQRACDSHPWKCLSPGESASYTWEEPMKPKKLSVRVGRGEWDETYFGKDNRSTASRAERKQRRPIFSAHFIENEEQGHFGATKTVKLEDIGYMDRLPCPVKGEGGKTTSDGLDSGLHCYVDTEGATRVLVVSDEAAQSLGGNEALLVRHLSNIKKELREEGKRMARINLIRASMSDTVDGSTQFMDESTTTNDLSSKLNEIVDYDEDLFITKPNQVIVEVLEATGLQSANLSGLSNPYCNVSLIEGKKKIRTFSFGSKVQSRSTYYVEKSGNPQWSRQAFVFDVPSRAANDPRETRRFSIHCVMQSEEKFGPNKFLGQAYVHLRNLEDQRECIGWYPLMGNVGKNEDSVDSIRGAIRLRVHWVFDFPGLLSYYSLCSERRIETLTKSKAGMKRQLKTLREEEKQRKETVESLSLTKVPALAATMYKKKKNQSIEPAAERRSSQFLKGMKRVAIAKSALVQFRMSKGDQGQNKSPASDDNEFEGVLDEINEVYASDFSDDDSVDSWQRMRTRTASSATTPSAEIVPIRDHAESVDNDDLPEIFRAGEDASNSPLKCHPHPDRARFQYLRRSSRSIKKGSTVNIFGTPLFTSLHISRAFINARIEDNPTKIQPSNKLPPPILVDDDEEGDHKYHHIISHLRLPSAAPSEISKRRIVHIRDLMHARTSFSKAARRSLESVLNPGGVLIIRPITALNLPDTYTNMFVKLRYGNKMYQTNKADSTVTPVWSDEETPDLSTIGDTPVYLKGSSRKLFERINSYDELGNDLNDIAEWLSPTRYWGTPKQNDLILNVDPFETSKSLHLTVIGEKLQTKEVIGVLEIPLGKALECCSQSNEDYQEGLNEGNPWGLTPAYVRWFPLMASALAVPVEGDMGQSTRPPDSEKVNDNMFDEYFAPCIKLALLFQPNHRQTEGLNTDQYLFTRVDCLSAAVIDSFRFNELLSFSSRDVDIRISVTKAKTRIALTVGNVQIDQHSSNKAPVIFAPSPSKYPNPTVQFLCWKDNVRSKNDMDSYDYIALFLEEMDLKIEEMWLFEVWEFYFLVMKKREARLLARQNILHSKSSIVFAQDGDTDGAVKNAISFLQDDREVKKRKKIYVCELMFGYTKINLSYYKSSKGNLSGPDSSEGVLLGNPGVDAFRQWSEEIDGHVDDRAHFDHVNMISTVFPSISDAPIKFQGKLIEHVFEFEGDISKYLLSFYASEALRQIYKIVGSLDFVGNPTMVVSSFGAGLRDFVLQPSRELKHLTKNPSRFGVGVMRGTLSLVSNSASGIFGFFSNVGSTIGSTAAILTLDKQFQELHSEQQAAQQRNYDRLKQRGFGRVTLLVTRPVHDVVFGLVSASTGLLIEPFRGAKNEGLPGFAKGTAVGVIGVFVKPIVGLSDAFAHVMESVHDLAKDINLLEAKSRPNEKYRLSYTFGISRILIPFNQVDSISWELLKAHPIDKNEKGDDEVIVTSEALKISSGLDQYIIVTTKRVVLFKVKVVDWHGFVNVNLVWQALIGEGVRITSSLGDMGHNSSILYISRFYSKEPPNDDIHLTFDESDQVDPNVISLRNRSRIAYPRPETPRQTGAPFRLRAWPFGASESVAVNRFVVDGEFKQRPNLLRVHNAICCLAGDFKSLIDEGNTNVKGEGVTVFGPMIFENESDAPKKANLTHLYNSLEHAAWECYSPEDEKITPSWFDEAHILRTYTSPLPNQVEKPPSNSSEEVVTKTYDPRGEASLSEGDVSSDHRRDSFRGAAPFNLNNLFIDDDAGFENEETIEDFQGRSISVQAQKDAYKGRNRSDDVLKSASSQMDLKNDDIFVEREQLVGTPSLEAISLQSWTPSQTAIGEHVEGQNSRLDERLRRVENVLENLAFDTSTVPGSIVSRPLSLIDNTFSLSHSENEYAISSSNVDFASTTSSSGKQSNRDAEIECLQREILTLRQQLNASKLDTVIEGTDSEGLSRSNHQEAHSKPKLKARMKKLFRGKRK